MFDIQRKAEMLDDGRVKVTVTPPSIVSDKSNYVVLTEDQFMRMRSWLNGSAMIQDALPDLSPSDREILMTGLGPHEWDDITKEPENE